MISSSVRYCFSAKCFVMLGTENSQMVPNQENIEGDQPVQSHSHAQQPLQLQTCVNAGALSWWNRKFVSFPGRLRNVSGTTFQSPELQYSVGVIWKETTQERLNLMQVSLLWHNSFLVSLWTFQPTLVKSNLKFSFCLYATVTFTKAVPY